MAASLRVIVLQHIACEHPGIFRQFMKEDGIQWDPIELDEGETIPDLAPYDAMVSMGGPMDVWQEDEFPWLVREKEAIHEAVRVRNMPFLGVCLGHQLLAEAAGGSVGLADTPEVGMLDVELTPDATDHPLMYSLPGKFKTLQWHGAEVKSIPDDASVLMSSPVCPIQSFAVGQSALGIQFHVETGPHTIDEWNAVPEYEVALRKTFGDNGAVELKKKAEEYETELSATADILYRNWANTLLKANK
ncbi:MAG: type 1 glutamine amidotransferase [Gammaproteobacteria bacterium]|nr:type 1 glutamine amidotransferase [Gammaproteobacteria bacterium]MYD77826.1 type 1 glutamine amidotransferase [Gammaproteobacteria bacterium]